MRFRSKNILVAFMLIFISILGIVFTNINAKDNYKINDKLKIVTSFYPMYIATLNLVSGIEDVELENLTQPQTGCLHDYQLTPNDMIKLETADIVIINGGGIESFVNNITVNYPNISIIDGSQNIPMLDSREHNHDKEHEDEINNAHVWVSITNYMKEIENIKNSLIKLDAKNKTAYEKNAQIYLEKLQLLKDNMHEQLKNIESRDIVIFHDSFEYIAQEFGLNVKHVVVMEEDTSLSAGEIAEIIDEIKQNNIQVLFTEEQYSTQIADSVAKETEAKVYVLDSCVNGSMDKDAYINAMTKNLEVMKEALK